MGDKGQEEAEKTLWINGEVCEDRDEWTKVWQRHCAEGRQKLKEREWPNREAEENENVAPGRKVTADMVLRGRRTMQEGKANGSGDCIAPDMFEDLPLETINEVTKCFNEKKTTTRRGSGIVEQDTSDFLEKKTTKILKKESEVSVPSL